ncbi:nucleotidyltransferase domain-containing protein [soil metagenome]
MQGEIKLARQIEERLGQVEGVVAVVLGGSWARDEAHHGSDLDLGIYYREEHPPRIEDLHRLAQELGYRHSGERVTDFGGWGPWINGGAWLEVDGQSLDWLYREIGQVSRIIESCRAGRTAVHYQPGHPHGFHEHFYRGEVHYCRTLHDPEGVMSALKNLADPYPPRLKRALIRDQLWEAHFALDTSRQSAARGDAYYVAGCLFRCASCITQALFALNERYLINEKGPISSAGSLPDAPPYFEATVRSVLASPGENPRQLEYSTKKLERLQETIEELCKNHYA